MIKSKSDYKEFLEADARANGYKYGILKHLNYTRKYLRCLRKVEYVNNCKSNSSLLLGGVNCIGYISLINYIV